MSRGHQNGSVKTDEQTPLLKDQPSHDSNITADAEEDAGRRAHASGNDDSAVPIADEPSTTRLAIILGSGWICVFFAALGELQTAHTLHPPRRTRMLTSIDATIIATISGPITATFHSFSLFSWLASGYLISNAAIQPLSGKLTDIYGRRNGLVLSNVVFCVGTLICGLANAKWTIILGRVVAGMGGGCLNTIATFIASDLVPLRRRGIVQGLGNIFFGTGAGLGGVFGGWIADVWSWRWAFLIQVPFIAIATIIVFFAVDIPVKETDKSKIKRVDFAGATSLVTTLVLLLLGLNSGGNIVPWDHPLVYVSLALSFVSLLVYIYVEERIASEPVIPVRLLLDRTVAAACLANWFSSMAYFAFLYYAPIYLQILGHSASAAGARLIPSSIGAAVGSLGSGFVMRATGRYWLLNLIMVCILVASGVLNVIWLGENTPEWQPFFIFALAGIGYGALITTTLLALISGVAHEHQAVITSASYAFRSTGSTIGISISSAVFQNVLGSRLWNQLGQYKDAGVWISRLRNDLEALKDFPEELKEKALHACMDALHAVWWTVLVMVVIAAVTSLAMRENVLHKKLDRSK